MTEIKMAGTPVKEMVKAKDLEGVKVIDGRGKIIGKVSQVHIIPMSFSVGGISIVDGLFNDKDFVGSEYIGSLSEEGAVLLMVPVTEYLGMDVYDSKGLLIGQVNKVSRVRKSNSVLSITVSRKGDPDLVITERFIKDVGENIVLNDTID